MPSPSDPALRRIASARDPWSVTIYADARSWGRAPRPSAGLAELLRAVRASLDRASAPASIAAAIDTQLVELADMPPERHESGSVGVFVTAVEREVLSLAVEPTPSISVGDRFVIAPLVASALALESRMLLLVASEHEVRLLDVTGPRPRALAVPELPRDLDAVARLDITGDRDTLAQLRTSEDPKERLRAFARAISSAIQPVVGTDAALLIAAAEPLASILREALAPVAPLAGAIPGNRDGVGAQQLAALAAPIVAQHRAELRAAQARRLDEAAPALVLRDPATIAEAARVGAIDTLLFRVDHSEQHPALDDLVRAALETDATLVALEPADAGAVADVAAILRYPMRP